MNQLILCSGRTTRPGWKTLDANREFRPDYLYCIPPLPPVVTDTKWDNVEWIHGITSFYPWEAEIILRQLSSCLTGVLVMEQPNARLVDAGEYPEWIFGDPTSKNPLHMNRWAYTPSSLCSLLRKCGFSRMSILPARYHVPERDFRVEAAI